MLGTWQAEWRARLGPEWRRHLVVLVALWLAAGFLRPIGDPDLPRHLALGQWMVEHLSVPFVEPWAWTRAGAPFYAYSWLPELVQYGFYQWWGDLGLRLFNGTLLATAGIAVLLLGRAARWRPWTVIVIALLHVGIASAVAGGQRPHVVLLTTIPLAWAMTYLVADWPTRAAPLVVLALANVVAANSHILFPAMAAPLVLLVARPGVDRKRIVLAVVATIGGWFVSPYALVWPHVFALNFGPNALFTFPTPIAELTPGFTAASQLRDTLAIFAIALAILPWVTASRLTTRERVAFGILWLGGLGVFALAVRGVVIWWLVTIPLAALAVEGLREPASPGVHRAQLAATYLVSALFVLAGLRADRMLAAARWSEGERSLPAPANAWVEPAAQWLDCHAAPEARGRLFNSFDFGDYLVWRLPRYSVSIDGRNIFPDSVARAEAYALAARGGAPLGPWRGADVAIVPDLYPVAAVLDTASGWHRVLTARPAPAAELSLGLWVRDDWWVRNGRGALPAAAERVETWREDSYECTREQHAGR